jgi:hypothetical protein
MYAYEEDMEEAHLILRESNEYNDHAVHVQRTSLYLDDSSYTKEQLIVSLRRLPGVHTFLKSFAVIWPDQQCPLGERVVRTLYNTITRLVLVACALLVTFNLTSYLSSANDLGDVVGWGLDVVFIFQSIALLISLVLIQRRLHSISTHLEISFFASSVPYCVSFFALSFFPALLYPIYHILVFFPDPSSNEPPISRIEVGVVSI